MTNPDVMIPVPFAQNGLKNPINVTRQPDQGAQDATWDAGFPPVTMQRKEVGGLPPNGLDFNGVLYALSADANHRQKGLSIEFNQEFATAIGGYPVGAKIRLTNGAYVESTVAGNTNNPNSNMTGWAACVIDNLTTNDPHKPVSAKQAKLLQDSKLDANKRGAVSGVASLDENKKVPVAELPGATSSAAGVMKLINDLTTGGTDAALTAEQGKLFFAMFAGGLKHFQIPDPMDPTSPWIIQFDGIPLAPSTNNGLFSFPISFTKSVSFIVATGYTQSSVNPGILSFDYVSLTQARWYRFSATQETAFRYIAVGK